MKPEDGPAYEAYLLEKANWRESLSKAAKVEVPKRTNFKRNKKALEFEIREYGLQDTEKNRVPYNKRKLLSGKSSGGSPGGFGGGNSMPYIPPPVEDVPDFDNEIPPPPPPPPPMPMGGTEFEDSAEPVTIPPPPPPLD